MILSIDPRAYLVKPPKGVLGPVGSIERIIKPYFVIPRWKSNKNWPVFFGGHVATPPWPLMTTKQENILHKVSPGLVFSKMSTKIKIQ